MRRGWLCVSCLVLLLAPAGCGSGGESVETQGSAQRQVRGQARRIAERQRLRQAHRAAVRARHEAARRHARRAAQERLHDEEEAIAVEEEAAEERESSECDPNYSGACLDPSSSDYDCEGGSGNGPDYTGPVTVVGEDHYGLDADGDRYGCE